MWYLCGGIFTCKKGLASLQRLQKFIARSQNHIRRNPCIHFGCWQTLSTSLGHGEQGTYKSSTLQRCLGAQRLGKSVLNSATHCVPSAPAMCMGPLSGVTSICARRISSTSCMVDVRPARTCLPISTASVAFCGGALHRHEIYDLLSNNL